MTRRRLLEPGRRLQAMFLAVAALSASTLLWLGWKIAQQDRQMASQRLQELRETAADLAVATLQKSLSGAEEQLSRLVTLSPAEMRRQAAGAADELPGDSLLVISHQGDVEAYPERRLPFFPESGVAVSNLPLFEEAERLEFREHNPAQALAALGALAASKQPEIRGGALLRTARIHRQQARWKEAEAIYGEIERLGGTPVDGLPAALVAMQARASLFERQSRKDEARNAAASLRAALDQRHYRLGRGAYEFYAAEAKRILGQAAIDPAPVLALATALESLPKADGDGGRRLLTVDGQVILTIWRGSGHLRAALLLGPKWLAAQWSPSLGPALSSQGVAVRLTDAAGQAVLGEAARGRESVRLASATGLPWNVLATTADPDQALAAIAPRQRLMIAGLAAIALLIVAGNYLVGRAASRELAVSRMQSDFVSAVSHEFRTPLTSLCLLSEHLAAGTVADEAGRAEYYTTLARESQRLRRMVEGLLNFGRMEAGAAKYRFEVHDPAEVVQSVVGEFERDAGTEGCRVEVRVDTDTPLVRADRAALACAVWNLLDNAVKYSPGCPTVWVEAGREDGRAAIRVRDGGLGIAARDQARIFEKFVRGEAAAKAGIRGTGIGLAMVRHIVAAHGGTVRVRSELGRGSEFTMVLPCHES